MNIRIIMVAMLALGLPLGAAAQVSENDFWASNPFLYRFDIASQDGQVIASYSKTTGDEPVGSGPWSLVILGPHGQAMGRQDFDLSGGRASVLIRYQPNGSEAQVWDSQGNVALTLDLLGSRICDEDGICESSYGEVPNNCPVDCGSSAQLPDGSRTASIAVQSGAGRKVGLALMAMALAATGLLVLRGIGGVMDRRNRP